MSDSPTDNPPERNDIQKGRIQRSYQITEQAIAKGICNAATNWDHMSGQGITRELSLGEVISKTLELYRRDFPKYLIPFLAVEVIIGVVTTLVRRAIASPTVSIQPGSQGLANLSGLVGDAFAVVAVTLVVTLIFYPIALGTVVKLASEQIQDGQTDMMAAIRFAIPKLVWMWVVGFVASVIVFLGFIALIVPGIILAIMVSLIIPVIIIESPGLMGTLRRSRQLVGKRWLKSFALYLVFGILIAIVSVILSAISGLFGAASTLVSSILSAFYLPLIPILLTVYYYSNVARTNPPPVSTEPTVIVPGVQPGMKYCPSCGAQLVWTATYCTSCGAKLTT